MTRVTQGAFSYLPDLTDEEITAQIAYMLRNDWAVSIEHTSDPAPRNNYWDMWNLPMFDLPDPTAALIEINECRAAHPDQHIRVSAYDASYGRQTTALSFIVNRPA